MPLVISDSSTLIHLASIGQLDLLKDFYETITIPPAIWTEVVTEGKGIRSALCSLRHNAVKQQRPSLRSAFEFFKKNGDAE